MPACWKDLPLSDLTGDSRPGKPSINQGMHSDTLCLLICSGRVVQTTGKPGQSKLAFYTMLGSFFAILRKLILFCVNCLLLLFFSLSLSFISIIVISYNIENVILWKLFKLLKSVDFVGYGGLN